MANWAKLQEDLTGLPVAKRAKYGIHFQKGDQIEAHFVGKPCHFQENGIWKPIDTALLATADGWFSSPHSDVIIHPDGRVRVKGSDYQQFTELPSAKAGKLAGDKIVREFPGGEQWLIMKEDGFREEIHVFKPTFPLEKFIAKTTGNLQSKYKAHPITAEDAAGNTYEFTGDVAAFGAWLDKAVYPVVIDPDFQLGNTTYGDTWLRNSQVQFNYGGSATLSLAAQPGIMRFDLTGIDSDATCSAASLKLTKSDGVLSSAIRTVTIYSIASGNSAWIEGTKNGSAAGSGEPCWAALASDGAGGVTTAWAGSAGLETANTDYESTSIGSFQLDRADEPGTQYTSALTALRVQGWFGVTNTNYGIKIIGTGSGCGFHSSEATTESYRPVLTVTYAAGGVPKHFMHYQRLRSL